MRATLILLSCVLSIIVVVSHYENQCISAVVKGDGVLLGWWYYAYATCAIKLTFGVTVNGPSPLLAHREETYTTQ